MGRKEKPNLYGELGYITQQQADKIVGSREHNSLVSRAHAPVTTMSKGSGGRSIISTRSSNHQNP